MNIDPRWTSCRKLRRAVFWSWIAITVAVAAFVGLTAPFLPIFGEDKALLAVVVPPTMIVLLGLGLGWLVLFVTAAPKAPDRHKQDSR